MPTQIFETSVHAKCILAGEHIVLRGGPALVIPLTQKNIHLTYNPSNKDNIILTKNDNPTLAILFSKTLEYALSQLGKDALEVHGKIELSNSINIGSGLGFSAALCVIVAKLLTNLHWLKSEEIFRFSHHLEELYHGKSSGADVAGVMASYPLHYEMLTGATEFKLAWMPSLYLSYSGFPKNTTLAIRQVFTINNNNPELAAKIDHKMKESVQMIEQALTVKNVNRMSLLISALEQAKQCFQDWGLIPNELQAKIDELYRLGALAVKPTGAGGGGHLISLWQDRPPHHADILFHPVFTQDMA